MSLCVLENLLFVLIYPNIATTAKEFLDEEKRIGICRSRGTAVFFTVQRLDNLDSIRYYTNNNKQREKRREYRGLGKGLFLRVAT
jgi:hypothetical protein